MNLICLRANDGATTGDSPEAARGAEYPSHWFKNVPQIGSGPSGQLAAVLA
jgi:hypothetical protein